MASNACKFLFFSRYKCFSSLNECSPYRRVLGITNNLYSTDVAKRNNFNAIVEQWDTSIKKTKTSKAMKAYLERAKNHNEFMMHQDIAYKIGKRHLANMMGEDPSTFTQEDVNRSIEYLFPSGLYDPKARPMMKEPQNIYPSQKEAEFDESGRPHHFLFYTGKANFFEIMFNLQTYIKDLQQIEDSVILKKAGVDDTTIIDQKGYTWMTQPELEAHMMETIMAPEYKYFINALEKFTEMPYSIKYQPFIDTFRKVIVGQRKALDISKPLYDANGRAYITTYECLRKAARGDVTIRSPGTGLVTVNGKDVSYFQDFQCREQVLFPLLFCNMLGSVDVECNVEGGGPSGQSGALRWGIAWSLRSFVDTETVEKMRLAGLLTRDNRRRERMKPGQHGSRKKYTWKKR